MDNFALGNNKKLSSIAFHYTATDCKNVIRCCPHMLTCKLVADWSIPNESTYGPQGK